MKRGTVPLGLLLALLLMTVAILGRPITAEASSDQTTVAGGVQFERSCATGPCSSVAPLIRITTPEAGAVLRGVSTVRGRVTASEGIRSIAVKLGDGPYVPVVINASWRDVLDATSLPNGSTRILARVIDNRGNLATAAHFVQVQNPVNSEPPGEPTPEPTAEPTPEPTPEPTAGPSPDKLLRVDFDDTQLGEYTEARAQADWQDRVQSHRTNGNGHVVTNPDGGRMLQARLPAHQIGNTVNFKVVLDRHYEEAYLSYRLKFGAGFDFSRLGGKLPGLAGGPDGYAPKSCESTTGTNGFSARMMWHRGGTLENYVYHTDSTTRCGHNFGLSGIELKDSRWYEIRQRVVMNRPGQRNGLLESWVDGVRRFSRSDFGWRAQGETEWGVNQLMFHTYFGGAVVDGWAHDRDEFIYYDDIVLEFFA